LIKQITTGKAGHYTVTLPQLHSHGLDVEVDGQRWPFLPDGQLMEAMPGSARILGTGEREGQEIIDGN
jgi:hypothetical protein